MDYAFDFIIKNGGIDTEKDYPYKGYDGRCDASKVAPVLASLLLIVYVCRPTTYHFFSSIDPCGVQSRN